MLHGIALCVMGLSQALNLLLVSGFMNCCYFERLLCTLNRCVIDPGAQEIGCFHQVIFYL